MTPVQSFRYLASLVWRADRTSSMLIAALIPINTVSFLGLAWAIKTVVDAAADGDAGGVWTALAVGALALGAIQTCFLWQGNLERLVSDKVSMELDTEVLTTLDSIPGIEHLEEPDHLDRVELVLDKGRDISAALWAATDIVSTTARLVIVGVLLVQIDPLLLVLPLAVVPMAFATVKAQAIEFKTERALAQDVRMRDALHDLSLEQTAAMELKIYGGDKELSNRSTAVGREIQRERLRSGLRASAIDGLGWFGLILVLVLVLWLTARQIVTGDASAGDIVLVWQLTESSLFAIRRLMWRTEAVQRSLEVLDRYMGIRDYAARQLAEWVDDSQVEPPAELSAGIELRNVSFTYPGTETAVLQDVSLRLNAGSVVALIGENGAGKSTLVKLLLGHYRPTEGQVLIDGVSVDRVDPRAWKSRTTATYQDFGRVEALLRESVGLGDVRHIGDDHSLETALVDAAADDIVTQLPAGLNTPLGKTYHDGVQPSGGQWQRLAISRSFLPEEVLLYVFDEPTSAVDPLHEAELLRSYADAAASARERGAITVMISHRFLTAREADLIVVLDGGEIVESGTHEELMTAAGSYAEMYELQSAAYR